MRKFAILVGVDHYADPALNDLAFASRDAVELGDCLRRLCGFDDVAVFADGVSPPFGPDDVYAKIRSLAGAAEPDDAFLFFFAGHGVFQEEQTFFLTAASPASDSASGAISLRELRRQAGALKARTRILVADACRNASPERGTRKAEDGVATRDVGLRRVAPRAGAPDGVAGGATWYSLFACSAGERSYEWAEARHGVFTHFLLEGLRGKARDVSGAVTLNGLNRYVTRAVVAWCEARGKPAQRPYAVTDGTPGDFVVVPTPPETPVATAAPVAARPWHVPLGDGAELAMAWCPPGSFRMGRLGEPIAEPPHVVSLTEGFWLGETPVTQRQWRDVMGTTVRDLAARVLADATPVVVEAGGAGRPVASWLGCGAETTPEALCFGRGGSDDDDLPVLFVGWADAADFCRRLTAREREAGRLPAGYAYRLPTEAEWEYACRAGTQADLYSGEPLNAASPYNAPALGRLAWYGGNAHEGMRGPGCDVSARIGLAGAVAFAREVRLRRPNGLGLHDMLGNVWEWCLDDYNAYPAHEQTDPLCRTPRGLPRKVIRGGGWQSRATSCTCHARSRLVPSMRRYDLGFRVALAPVRG